MHAAVVRSFDQPPRYGAFPDPAGDVVEVLAAALHPRVRSTANGTHYESTGELPLIPGIDGVGRTAAGELVYFVLPDTLLGSMAERVAIDRRRCAVLPTGVDPVAIAAAMNPAMSSWIALRKRIALQPGASVLVLGATGNAGSLAIQVARRLGAGEVIAAGRDRARLDALGADRAVTLDEVGAAADVDVVLDYLWGTVAAAAIPAILARRADRGRPLTWVTIGSMAGLELPLPSEWLRAARLQIVGSGQGSVPTRDIAAELPALAAHLTDGGYAIDAVPTPLSDVEQAWARPTAGRVVFVP
jgi:NADPH:quinone reductase-like Zn-dependent oxidoreductase